MNVGNPPVRYRKSVPDSWIELTITEGRKRQLLRMTAAVADRGWEIGELAVGAAGGWVRIAYLQWFAEIKASNVDFHRAASLSVRNVPPTEKQSCTLHRGHERHNQAACILRCPKIRAFCDRPVVG